MKEAYDGAPNLASEFPENGLRHRKESQTKHADPQYEDHLRRLSKPPTHASAITQYPSARGIFMVGSVNAFPSPVSVKIQTSPPSPRGILQIPRKATSIIVFVHGDGSSSMSPRNRLVARALLQRGFGVLLPDLTDETDDTSAPAGCEDEINRTASRLTAIIDWLASNPKTRRLSIGLFGGRSGAASAMIAAALRPDKVHAVISRGGRPDLADRLLQDVKAPTLMIVGSHDRDHIAHNRKAGERMKGKPMLEVIDGASHLFGEPGKLEQVASMACCWFQRNLALCG